MQDNRRIEYTLDLILVELRTLNTFLRLAEVSVKQPSAVQGYETSARMEVKLPREVEERALRR